jgi:2-dehydropantoate 2-reductase
VDGAATAVLRWPAAEGSLASRGPRVTVLGTGALACAVGAHLARFGRASVTLVGTWPEALHAIATHGIVVDEPSGVWSAHVGVSPLSGPHGPADVVLVLVKSHQTEAIARTAARCLLPSSLLVTLQNGIGNRETLEAAAGEGRVGQGISYLASTVLGPGEVRVTQGRIVLGRDPSTSPGVTQVAELLRKSRLETDVSEIDHLGWGRLAVACAIEPLSALTARGGGALLETPEPCETLLKAAREVGAVAAAHGIDLGDDPASLAVTSAETATANRSSMFHDLARGARTEIDALCGAVVREGEHVGVPTPVNEYLWLRIREKEGRPVPARPSAPA